MPRVVFPHLRVCEPGKDNTYYGTICSYTSAPLGTECFGDNGVLGMKTMTTGSEDIPEDQYTLSARYATMLDTRSETVLFDRYNRETTEKYETELSRVLRDTFDLHELDLCDSK